MSRKPTIPAAAALLAVAAVWLPAAAGPGKAGARTGPVRVAIFAGDGVGFNCMKGYEKALGDASRFAVRRAKPDEFRSDALRDTDVVLFPGGTALGEAKSLGEAGRDAVRAFVERGGGYVGFCAGFYLAVPYHERNVGLLDAKVVDMAHWARGAGDVKVRLSAEGRKLLGGDADVVTLHYENGPVVAPGADPAVPDYEVLATFETEMHGNGAPAGMMKGTPAIVRASSGKGRLVCFSPHPELTPGLEDYVRRAVDWSAGRGEPARGKP